MHMCSHCKYNVSAVVNHEYIWGREEEMSAIHLHDEM